MEYSIGPISKATYFIHPDYTGKGLGRMLLGYLEKAPLDQGIP
jgi:GNAT superfamily N-acetyltransferase